jgi:hypothetical protein
LFHGIARPSVLVAVSMNGSFVVEKELHVDPARRGTSRPEARFHWFTAVS